jgi:hypothetical protein
VLKLVDRFVLGTKEVILLQVQVLSSVVLVKITKKKSEARGASAKANHEKPHTASVCLAGFYLLYLTYHYIQEYSGKVILFLRIEIVM